MSSKREYHSIKKQFIDKDGDFDFKGYHAAKKEFLRLERLKYRPIKGPKQILKRYRTSATKRGFSFELAEHFFFSLIEGACEYCGDTPALGVDRLNSSIGYIPYNVTPCCAKCNLMKYVHSKEVFLEHAHKIARYNNALP